MDNAHKNTDKNPTQNPLLYFNTATIMGRRIRDMVVGSAQFVISLGLEVNLLK